MVKTKHKTKHKKERPIMNPDSNETQINNAEKSEITHDPSKTVLDPKINTYKFIRFKPFNQGFRWKNPGTIAFVILFAAVGCYFIYNSFAATGTVTAIEAESMTLPTGTTIVADSTSSGGKAIDIIKNGTASTVFSLPSSASSVSVSAKGTACAKFYPVLNLQVNGITVLKQTVKSTAWNTYSISTTQTAGTKTLAIVFTNNYGSSSCARHLYVDKVTFIGDSGPISTAPTVSLSTSPTTVTSGGTSTLTWTSTNANNCSASGGWSGSQATYGSGTTGILNTTTTFNLNCTGSGGTTTATTNVTVTTPPPPPAATGKTLEINTTNYPRIYGNCATIVPATATAKAQLSFNITSACNPAGDGHYRTDWSNIDTFTADKTLCSSIPINFPNGVPAIGSGSWLQFAEAKIPSTAYADWALYVHNKFDGSSGTEFDLRMAWVSGSTSGPVTYGTGHPSLWHGGTPASGWNTFVICSNYSATTSGFLDLYLNGVLVRSISGVAILQGQTTDDLDINDYTGGSPANIMTHGAPMLGTTVESVKQAGGWNSAP